MLPLLAAEIFAAAAYSLGSLPAHHAPISPTMAAVDRPIRVAVVGGGPAGACAAEIFAEARARLPWAPRCPIARGGRRARWRRVRLSN